VRVAAVQAGEADMAGHIGGELAKLTPTFVHKPVVEVFLIRLNYKTQACDPGLSSTAPGWITSLR
jgi:hypothetical protein